MEQTEVSASPLFGLTIDNTGKNYLSEAARWARFISIVGFIFLALFVVLAIFGGAFLSQMFMKSSNMYGNEMGGSFAIGIVIYYLIVAFIGFFMYLFLYRFGNKMKAALATNNQDLLNGSFLNLKLLYRYLGIIMIIGLAFVVIGLLVGIVGVATLAR
jgi:hypothetical protein